MKELEIDGKKYQMAYWEPEKALERLTKLISLVGEPVAKLMIGGGAQPASTLASDDGRKIAMDAFSSLALRLNEKDVKSFITDCQDQLLCDHKAIVFNVHYKGKIGHLMKVTFHQVRYQFADFLEFLPVQENASAVETGSNTSQAASL